MPQTTQLHDLRMVHKHVDVDPELANVPVIHLRIGRLEHDLFRRKFLHDRRDNVRPPRSHVLRDPLGLDHQAVDARVEEFLAEVDQLRRVGGADGFEVRGRGVAAGAELDPEFGFGFEVVGVDFFDEAEPVVAREGEEAGGEFDDVESLVLR